MKNFDCPFCNEYKNKINELIKFNRIILETKSFIVIPTVGGFLKNYLLIVPKKHINCFGELSLCQFKELNQIILWQKKINKKYFNMKTSMFEHGTLNPNNESGKSIIHAHLHVFPNNISLIPEIDKYDFGINKIDNIENLKIVSRKYNSYLYYNDIDNKDYIITHQGVPSQFLRKVLAKVLNIDTWNWREYPLINEIKNTTNFYKNNSIFNDYKGEKR